VFARTIHLVALPIVFAASLSLGACKKPEPATSGTNEGMPEPAAQCGKDTDCKGDRICQDGKCMAMLATASSSEPAAAMASAPANPYACDNGEKVLFTCTTTNKKQLLLCDAGQTLRYTLGKAGIPPEMNLSVARGSASTQQWSGMGRWISYSINIPNVNTLYEVFWGADRMADEHDIEAGVNVGINGRQVATVKCRPDTVQNFMEGVDLKPAE